MEKQQIFEIVKIVCTALISIAATLFCTNCTASMSISKYNTGSQQNTQQTTTTNLDSICTKLQ